MNKKKLIILALCAVLLFAAAVFGYNYLSENYKPESGNLSGASSAEEPESEENTDPSEPAKENSSAEETVMAPDFTVYDAEGNAVSLSDFSGKPVVINFWATWCGYCVREMPAFEKAAKEYGDDVIFMMINVTDGQSETKEEAMEFIAENGYSFPVYYDTELSATYAYGAYSLPATGFITPSGIFAGGQMGALSEEALFSYIDQLLLLE
ncbi:MAG: TlpA family protein disulfide reductase [Oscillospiraceae bacterium]|nr:TlpA family protein disulfide reductase [Oscillospiraceae bacterium]